VYDRAERCQPLLAQEASLLREVQNHCPTIHGDNVFATIQCVERFQFLHHDPEGEFLPSEEDRGELGRQLPDWYYFVE
jgi:hypothetical protein